jgi:hypothetical protein
LTNAKNSYDKSERQLGVFSDKLDGVQQLQDGGARNLPPSP